MWFYRYMALFVLVAFVALTTCMPDEPVYWQHHYQNQFPGQYHYDVVPDKTSFGGIRVDTSGQMVDLAGLDDQTNEVEACLGRNFGTPPHFTPEQVHDFQCDGDTFPLPIIRADLVVKVAADWEVSKCADPSGIYEQVLPSPAPEALCVAKMLPPCSASSYCRWRAGIEDNRYIVVTQDLYLYKDPLIRMVTGCNNPWAPVIADCAHR